MRDGGIILGWIIERGIKGKNIEGGIKEEGIITGRIIKGWIIDGKIIMIKRGIYVHKGMKLFKHGQTLAAQWPLLSDSVFSLF
jgi:hypothetical protein